MKERRRAAPGCLPDRPGLLHTGVVPAGRPCHQVGVCATQGDFKMLYLATRMCDVSPEIYTFSVKDTSAV